MLSKMFVLSNAKWDNVDVYGGVVKLVYSFERLKYLRSCFVTDNRADRNHLNVVAIFPIT